MEKEKIVAYNGSTESFFPCGDPSLLSKERVYEVTSVTDLGSQTNYTLKGIRGEFNANWFEDVPPMRIATAISPPVAGERYSCRIINWLGTNPSFYPHTFNVESVIQLSTKMYLAKTKKGSVYYIQTLCDR